MTKKLITIIVPVLNEEDNILLFYDAVTSVINKLDNDFEIVFTDNHSEDETFSILKDLSARDKRIKVYRFSRNFGYQHSILEGYKKSKGDAVIQIDCDLEDPPALISTFLNLWSEGYQVVYGVRKMRHENFFLKKVRYFFYRLVNLLSEHELPVDAGDFRLVDRKIVDLLKNTNDAQPYLRGSIALMGFNQIGVEYDRKERLYGHSKFSIPILFNLAIDAILNHSTRPLRVASFVGVLVGFVAFIGTIVYFLGKLFYGMEWPAGYATIVILLLAGLSLNAIFLGIIGEYVGKIYKQVRFKEGVIIEKFIDNDQLK
ncbi:glycosyltransferase family 2 protein [Candidatus Woesearchaeota archaeon]|jgi:dolichol-phosphate mannosyltransferase|nr:glycosyltransferase family 2 protein [Candidatus Woesearchaeota archaeon]